MSDSLDGSRRRARATGLRRRMKLLTFGLGLAATGSASAPLRAQNVPVNPVPADYVVAPLTANCLQDYRLYLPGAPWTKPAAGWPVVIHFDISTFTATEDFPEIVEGHPLDRVLDQGIAVITARSTISLAGMPCEPGGELQFIPGDGKFHPPGFVPADLGHAPYDDPAYAMPEKDAAMVIQHVRYHAGQGGHLLQDIDRHGVAVHGGSAGAIALMWAAFGPDRRGTAPFAGLGGQYDMPTRPDVAVLFAGTVWWPIFDPQLGPLMTHFGSGGFAGVSASTIGDVSPVELIGASALYYDEVMLNASLPLYVQHDTISHCEDHVRNDVPVGPFPFSFDGGGQEGLPNPPYGIHPSWAGYTWKTLYPERTRLVISTPEAQAQAHGVPFDDVPVDDVPQDIADWLRQRFDEPMSCWIPITQARLNNDPDAEPMPVGVGGTYGVPELTGAGELGPGTPVTLTLTGARKNSPAYAVVGINFLQPPFGHANEYHHAGILVPTSDIVLGDLQTDGSGALTIVGTWPVGVAPFTQAYYQVWVEDNHADGDYAASNALQSTAP